MPAPVAVVAHAVAGGTARIVTAPACPRCDVMVGADGRLRARVDGSSAHPRSAFRVVDFGGAHGVLGRVYTLDRIGLGAGQEPRHDVRVLVVRDTQGRVVYELYVSGRDRTLSLRSPDGGLRATSISASTGVVVPNDGHSTLAVAVSARANDSVRVTVNGVPRLALTNLAGANTSAPRFLATGIVGSKERVTAIHEAVAVRVTPAAEGDDTTRVSVPVAQRTPAPLSPAVATAPPDVTPAPASPPTADAPPAIAGNPRSGSELTASAGRWSDEDARFTYAWQRCDVSGGSCDTIAGANGSTYALDAGDVGSTIRVAVTARTLAGSTTAVSAPTARIAALPPLLANTQPPTLAGDAVENGTLAATAGAWSDPAASLSYGWQRCDADGSGCEPIAGAAGAQLPLTAREVGGTVRVVVSAANAGGSVDAVSAPSAVVAPATPPPASTARPALSGDAVENGTLAATTGTWNDPQAALEVAWQRCDASGASCAAVDGASGAQFPLTSADVGSTLRVVVTATNSAGTAQAVSDPSAVVRAAVTAPANTTLPTLSGDAVEGATLAAAPGTWSDPAATLAFSWQRCDTSGANCGSIDGATGAQLPLTTAEVGSTIRAVVTATNAGGSTVAASEASAVVAPAPPAPPVATGDPGISGDAVEGAVLSASPGGWSDPSATLSFAWQRCDASGGSCGAVDGASGSQLPLTSGDVGSTFRVVVTATNAGGSATATSAPSGVVAAAQPPAPTTTDTTTTDTTTPPPPTDPAPADPAPADPAAAQADASTPTDAPAAESAPAADAAPAESPAS